MFKAGYEVQIGMKTSYIEYDDIENPMRSHMLLADGDQIYDSIKESAIIYHRNEFTRQDGYE